MNRYIITLSVLLVGGLLLGGCGRTVAHASTDAGPVEGQLSSFEQARMDYLLWEWRRGQTPWQAQRARELSNLQGVGARAR